MKKTVFILISFLVIGNASATVRRVTNQVGTTPVAGLVFVNTLTNGSSDAFAQALSAAVNGDTIYVEPSTLTYGNHNFTKRLIIIGNGYEIGVNAGLTNPLPYTVLESTFGNLTFLAGSEQSQLIGIRCTSNGNLNANEIRVKRCMFDADLSLGAANCIIEECFFGAAGAIFGIGVNTIIRNCIIGEFIQTVNFAQFDQCYIHSFSTSFITNCTFTNCIINTIPANCPLTNSFSHCIKVGTGTTFPVAGINNNIEGIDMSALFIVANPYSTNPIRENRFKSKSGSPALLAGNSGQDIGPFGGNNPYRLSGQAPIPVITNFFLSTTGSTASGLTGSITIQSNN
ncbi:hypothetical protein [Lacihabitans soyangensis]|uniref:Right handed beta helix domain-containing protein n=1 Tax=Lacihabitans soyangensis TaxID=869394 RepID=A0AAE3H3U8_9BACT|nr:hypothetical protein [Lacihabitans soyangensis]MCP9763571.1 hypothetical protein [Lacihabitans soyangensis]